MGMAIKNSDALCSHGLTQMRADALTIVSSGLAATNPALKTCEAVSIHGNTLIVNKTEYDLGNIKNIYFVGTGKASFPIAETFEQVLGDKITEGILIVKKGEKRTLKNIQTYEAGHPIPDEHSIIGARKILEILNKAGKNDIVFAAITGGASAMTVLPPGDITLDDMQIINELLLKSGAAIAAINTVRRHLCLLKGGRLVSYAQPARIITITLETVDDSVMPWPDMSKIDRTTFADAIKILQYYDLVDKTPQRIMKYLCQGLEHPELETVKSFDGMNQTLISVGNPAIACQAASNMARDLGYNSYILSTNIEGESAEVGICFSGIAKEILKYDRPFQKPCAIITGGETTVTIGADCGSGGPNMELVLSFAGHMDTASPWVCIAIDTDGTDGPTEYAGAMADTSTGREIEAAGFSIKECLKNHASAEVFVKTDNIVYTGHTGTNVMNLRVILLKEG